MDKFALVCLLGATLVAVAPAQSIIHRFEGNLGDALVRVAGPLQLDGDGVSDYVMAQYGEIIAVSGQKGNVLYSVPTVSLMWLPTLHRVGDVNGDGYDDFLSASIFDDTNGPWTGRVTVHSGLDGSTIYNYFGAADTDGDGAGEAIGDFAGGVGDINADGVPDFCFSAIGDGTVTTSCNQHNGPSYLDLRSGADGSLIKRHSGSGVCYQFRTAHGLGDLNGDGINDYGMARTWNGGTPGSFSVRSGADHSQIRSHQGFSNGDWFGVTGSGLGDVDNDGVSDYAVGSPYINGTLDRVRIYSGATGSQIYDLAGASSDDYFGWAICDVGDFNGDGHDDFAISAPLDGTTTIAGGGRVSIFSGFDASALWSYEGDVVDLWMSTRNGIVNLGDVNFDGVLDLAIGCNRYDAVASAHHGEIRVISTGNLSFTQDGHLISITNGGQADFTLDAGPNGAGDTYFVIGSATGFSPGIATPNNIYIPLIPDMYFDSTVNPLQNPISFWTGYLDANGQGSAFLNVPAGVLPGFLVGISLYHCFVTYDLALGDFEFGSNHVVLTFTN